MADIVYTTVAFPPAFTRIPYEAAIGYTGATIVTAAAVNSGALPTGLIVNADHTRITGTPTVSGVFTFTLTMTDTGGAVISGSYTITVVDGAEWPPEVETPAEGLKTQWPTEF
jgi:large repetitive protein